MAATDLTTLGSWKRQFYRLCNTHSTDDDLTEHDNTSEEGVELAIQAGLDAAQEFLLAVGLAGWWVTRDTAITSWSGTDDVDGGTYTTLPSDFLRLAGDHVRPALVEANGDPWGFWCEWENRRSKGNGYYFRDGKLWLLRTAEPPATLYLEYVKRLPLPDDDTTAFTDFPKPALPLIPAFAAEYAMAEGWLPGGEELEQKIERHLLRRRQEARLKLRLTQGPRRLRSDPVIGNEIWS